MELFEKENKMLKYWIEVYYKRKKIDNYEFNTNEKNGENIEDLINYFYNDIYISIEVTKEEIKENNT